MNPPLIITPTQLLRKKWYRLDYWLAFGLGSGLSPKAPGTMGTVMAIPFFILLMQLSVQLRLGVRHYSLVMLLAAFIGVWFCQSAGDALGHHKHKAIVWGKMVGYWWAMWVFVAMDGPGRRDKLVIMLIVFIFFRLFDIWKPWPISWLNRHVKGGLGVMIDGLAPAAAVLLTFVVLFLVIMTMTCIRYPSVMICPGSHWMLAA